MGGEAGFGGEKEVPFEIAEKVKAKTYKEKVKSKTTVKSSRKIGLGKKPKVIEMELFPTRKAKSPFRLLKKKVDANHKVTASTSAIKAKPQALKSPNLNLQKSLISTSLQKLSLGYRKSTPNQKSPISNSFKSPRIVQIPKSILKPQSTTHTHKISIPKTRKPKIDSLAKYFSGK